MIGPKMVATMNHFVSTRSVYSRRRMAHSLPLTTHPLLDARGADALHEDLMERRLDDLEAADRDPLGDELADELYAIPIVSPHVRSLNLATAVAIVVYEARRQLGADR